MRHVSIRRRFCAFVALSFLGLFAFSHPAAAAPIRDFEIYPQDPRAYLAMSPDLPLASDTFLEEQHVRFLKFHFLPWDETSRDFLLADASEYPGWQENVAKAPWWEKKDRTLIPRGDVDAIAQNARVPFGSLGLLAVALRDFDLRILPTERAFCYSPASANGKRPFDMLQNSSVKPAEPLLVHHASNDGNWVFVSAGQASGWAKTSCVMPVSRQFADHWRAGPFAVVIRDNLPLFSASGSLLGIAKLGTLLRLSDDGQAVLIPSRTGGRGDFLEEITLPNAAVAPWPLPFTAVNATAVLAQIKDEPYGWGGSQGFRDCSATTRDYFAPFGIWLPRNSKNQSRVGGAIAFPPKSTLKERGEILKKQGTPFSTLIWMPGHIMLYVGTYKDIPVVFHNFWGIAIREKDHESRYVVGRSAFTSLEAGKEISSRIPGRLLGERMQSFNLVLQ